MIIKMEIKDVGWVKVCEKYGLEKLSKSVGETVQTLINTHREQNELIKDYGSDVASKINGFAIEVYEDMKNKEKI